MIDHVSGIDFPILQRDLPELFGTPNARRFARDFLVTMDFSEFAEAFAQVRDFVGNPWRHRIYGNYVMERFLRKALAAVVAAGLAGELKTYEGCFNIRRMKGGNAFSVHSWGLAIDFNAATNPFGRQLITDFSDEFVACFLNEGFEWGGSWGNPNFDAMHFQLPHTR